MHWAAARAFRQCRTQRCRRYRVSWSLPQLRPGRFPQGLLPPLPVRRSPPGCLPPASTRVPVRGRLNAASPPPAARRRRGASAGQGASATALLAPPAVRWRARWAETMRFVSGKAVRGGRWRRCASIRPPIAESRCGGGGPWRTRPSGARGRWWWRRRVAPPPWTARGEGARCSGRRSLPSLGPARARRTGALLTGLLPG